MSTLLKEHTGAFLFILLSGVLVTIFYAKTHILDGDVYQLLTKAHVLVTEGRVIPYGNASSSGSSGNVPGSFLTLSSGLPMKLWHSPYAALIVLFCYHLLAFGLLLEVLKKYFSSMVLLCFAVLYWLNPWRAAEVFLWNPGYMYLPGALHLWSALKLSEKKSLPLTVVHVLSLFMGLQVHASFVILGLASVLLWWRKSLKIHWTGVFLGTALGMATLVPYILAGLENPEVFPQPGSGGKGFLFFGLVYVYPLLKAFWYWILMGSSIYQSHLFHAFDFSWMNSEFVQKIFSSSWNILKYAIGATGVLISFYVNFKFAKANKFKFKFWKRSSGEGSSIYNPLINYATSIFIAGMMAGAISPTVPIFWHMLFLYPAVLIPLLIFLNGWLPLSRWQMRAKPALWGLAIYLVFFNIFAALGSKKHSYKNDFHQLYQESICKSENCES